jgi:hypothetical protein
VHFGVFHVGNDVSYDVMALQKFASQLEMIDRDIISLSALMCLGSVVKSVEIFIRKQHFCFVTDQRLIDIEKVDFHSVRTLKVLQDVQERRLITSAYKNNSKSPQERRLISSASKSNSKSPMASKNNSESPTASLDCRAIMMATTSEDDDDDVVVLEGIICLITHCRGRKASYRSLLNS